MKPIEEYEFFKKLTALPFIEAIYLYGSRARDSYRLYSDIDLAFQLKSHSEKDWSRIEEIIEDADTLLEIDCVRLGEIPLALAHEINKKNQLLFKKTNE